ncbi:MULTISPECIES: hypothetical protein [unclassified Paenibacillus]|uniref:hypothetical protein n=1 Tax=unclassified Paenibacillus TaxID=185978 RepID=UPI001C0FA181|nr:MULTISPECIES: hypothetical protein [unclassified Paenibacillus]MBU5441678.1 hypothetical protein [Paenibacillus sp. MSJ-34]CAH0118130.1 hypothetical protein PAE9249_00596 [Paenibacillus sp. CECT 9249]
MKKVNKVLTLGALLAMTAIPMAAQAQGPVQAPANQAASQAIVDTKLSGTEGKISDVNFTKDGKRITVKGQGLTPQDPGEIILNITKDTVIVDENGKKISLQKIVKKDMKVKAYYGPKMTRSLPPIGTADKIVAVKDKKEEDKDLGTKGVIVNANNGRLTVMGSGLTESSQEVIILGVTDQTKIVDRDGKELPKEALKENTKIKAYYGPMLALSMPPMGTAEKIVVLDETDKVEGNVVFAAQNEKHAIVHVDAKADGKIDNDVVLNVTGKTNIFKVNGEKVELSDLKPGTKVVGYYAPVSDKATKPALSKAEVIIVQENN